MSTTTVAAVRADADGYVLRTATPATSTVRGP